MSPQHASLDALADRVVERVERGESRVLIGITGAPGAGKSTVAEMVRHRIGAHLCAVVPMDGFHLANSVLEGTPLQDRKGAIDTFDVHGYLALMRRLRAADERIVYAPEYRRGLEESIAGAIPVPRRIRVVITEGLYLLADAPHWRDIPALLDETWFVRVPEEQRVSRLVARHVGFGKTEEEARAWAAGPDEVNARMVLATEHRAARVIDWD